MTADAVGGVWNYATGLCAALPDIRFILAVMGPPLGHAQLKAADLPNVAIEHRPYRLEWMEGAAADLEPAKAWLADLVRRHQPDLLHVNGYAHAAAEFGHPTVVVAHSDVLSWWHAVHGVSAPASWNPYREAVIAGLRGADAVVAIGDAVLADLRRHYGLPLADAQVVRNGIDLGRFAPGSKQPVVLAAGRVWDEAKNLAVLDRVAARLAWPVEIAGDAAHPEHGETRLEAARALGRLTPSELAERMAPAAIFAAPARYEPFGLGILEAAASGCALVLGDIPSLRENWDGAALFVAPNDADDLAAGISRLIAEPALREQLGNAARRCAGRFSLAAMARRYRALYAVLIGQAPRRAVA